MRNHVLFLILVAGCGAVQTHTAQTSGVPPPKNNVAYYHGCPVFTDGDWYNAPIAKVPIDLNSAHYVQSMYENGDASGFVVYNVDPPPYRVNLATNRDSSYRVNSVPWHQNEFTDSVPWNADFFIESQSDAHAIVLNTQTCRLTEFYQGKFSGGELSAYSGWTWNLRKPLTTPSGNQPSSTASGLPIFAGLLKGEEIESSAPIDHALNFAPPVGSISPSAFVEPATSTGGCEGCKGPNEWPMPYGAHLRLRSDFELSCGAGCPQAQKIVQALKNYGAFIYDTGSKDTGNQLEVAFDAAGHNPWIASDLANLEQIHITDMQLLRLGPLSRK